jgi:type IV pilus assembly protein PilY1
MTTSSKHFETRDRRRTAACVGKRALVGGFLAAMLLAPGAARAQSDVTPALPNVLILLDSSGSMERFPNATLPTVGPWATSGEKTRWIQALEVLGGALENYKLLNEPRSKGTDFETEYALGSGPYDLEYSLSHYRPLSNDCAIGPSLTKTWPADWTTWGTSSFGFRKWGGSALGAIGSCGVTDIRGDGLGILDTYRDQARFALMTFDTNTSSLTGWNGTSHDAAAGMAGTWSYFPGWDGTGTSTPAYGWPAGCSIDPGSLSSHLNELGARNPAAPPWEGPLVPFASTDSTDALRTVNDRIRYAMLAMRPYGATPLAPMLADAQHYLWDDPKGPKIDPAAACRGNFIILITDGFPNSDLRPQCENNPDPKAAAVWPKCDTATGGGGCCPTKRAQDIAYELAHPTDPTKPLVNTFVVGFALSDDSGAPIDCTAIDPGSGSCASSSLDPKYKPCCTLHEIAFNGGTNRAVLASDSSSLRTALNEAMASVTKKTTTSRTVPVFTANAGTAQAEFRSSFKVNAFGAWTGILERIRWACSTTGPLGAAPLAKDFSAGDDYENNLLKIPSRTFMTYDATAASAKSTDTLRPNLPSTETDGIAAAVPTQVVGAGSTFVSSVSAAMMNITTACADTATPDECRTKLLNYALALPQPKTTWLGRTAIPLGDIYHATPVPVGPPSAFLRDESYTLFRNSTAVANRIPFMLTATNDGLLHAFKTTVKSDSDPESELYGFIPPAVLTTIGAQYGGAHALLLDASPVVKDVAFAPAGSSRPWGRTGNDARGGTGSWKTIAVGALTSGSPGYYALDVTDSKNPKMLWQLTKYKEAGAGGTPPTYDLFGQIPGTPAIGTIYVDDAGVKVETPVAFLPGGSATRFAPGLCKRWPRTSTSSTTPDTYTTPRDEVGCWTGPGNSFTIVRLWDGKILKTFRNNPAAGDGVHPTEPSSAAARWAATGKAPGLITDGSGVWPTIDSPITGAVGVYPAATGTVTTRAFVGDYDGTLWKIDISDPKPENWTFSMFHDAYFPGDTANKVQSAWGPIAVPPVISVDRFGDVVVNYATGDQNNFATTNLNHVYSITERTTIGAGGVKSFVPKLNWHIKLANGITPTGPLSLFDANLFFSTFVPSVASKDACLNGQGVLWGVHYLEADKVVNDDLSPVPHGRHTKTKIGTTTEAPAGECPSKTATGGMENVDTVNSSMFRCIVLEAGTIVFGAGITQRPSCITEAASATGIDPYTGATTTHSAVGDMSVGEFQLVAQTGPAGAAASGGVTKTYTRTLVPPNSTTRIDSWASIVE